MWYETSSICSLVHTRGAPAADSWAPFLRGLHPAALPNPTGQCMQGASGPDRSAAQLCHAKRTQCYSGLPHPRAGLCAEPIPPPEAHSVGAGYGEMRAMARPATREPAYLWQVPQHLDAPARRRGLLGARLDPLPGEHREHSPSAQAAGGELAADQTLDHQSRSPICAKKSDAIA
jgi:hypothetical protein